MAQYKQTGLLTYVDEAGNQYLLYPMTQMAAVDGLENALAELEDKMLPKSGGSMTGRLYGPEFGIKNDVWPSCGFYNASGQRVGSFQIASDSNRAVFNQQETGADYAERYMLPARTDGLTADVWYSVLTSKNPVTVAQGGTGATTAAAARANLEAVSKATTTASLTAAGWSGGAQTVSVSGVTADNTVLVAPAAASFLDYRDFGVRCTGQGAGTLSFTCENTPTAGITVNVLILT